MRLPALHTKGLNVPGIMQAQQDYRLGEAKLAKYGREAEKEELVTGLRAGAAGGDESMLAKLFALDPAEGKAALEFGESLDEVKAKRFQQAAGLTAKTVRDLGKNPSPPQVEQAIKFLGENGIKADDLGIRPEQIEAIRRNPEELNRVMVQLATRAEVVQKQMARFETEPRKTREIKRGDEIVTEEYDPTSGRQEEIAKGPRFAPPSETNVNVAASDPSSLLNYMTKTQKGKEAQEMLKGQSDALKMVKHGASLIKSLNEAGDQAVSWSGALVRAGDTLVSQGRAIAKDFGIKMGDGSIARKLDPDDWFWGDLAEESSVIRSKILGLAVAITKADQGSRPSDFDVQTSIERIAGEAGSAKRMAAVVNSLIREKMGDFAISYNTRAPGLGLPDFDWDKELERNKITLSGPENDPLGIRHLLPDTR